MVKVIGSECRSVFENAKAYLDSEMFKNDVFVGLKPLWSADPEVRIYIAA